MKRYVAFTAAAALLASAGLAKADTAEGVIAGIDWERQVMTLDTGEEFVVPQHFLNELDAGDRVIVNFEQRDGQLHAQNVIPDAGAADLGTADPAVTADPAMPADPAVTADPAMPADPAVTADPAIGAAETTDPSHGIAGAADPDTTGTAAGQDLLLGDAGTVEGRVAGIDWSRSTMTLDTGEEFIVPEHDLQQIQTGDYVIVGFERREDGQVVASSVIHPQPGTDSPAGGTGGGTDGGTGGDTQQ